MYDKSTYIPRNYHSQNNRIPTRNAKAITLDQMIHKRNTDRTLDLYCTHRKVVNWTFSFVGGRWNSIVVQRSRDFAWSTRMKGARVRYASGPTDYV